MTKKREGKGYDGLGDDALIQQPEPSKPESVFTSGGLDALNKALDEMYPGWAQQSIRSAQPDLGAEGWFQAMFGQPQAQKAAGAAQSDPPDWFKTLFEQPPTRKEGDVWQAVADWKKRDPDGFNRTLKEAVSEAVAGMQRELEAMTKELQRSMSSSKSSAPDLPEAIKTALRQRRKG
ncbi:MAG TPA: hypothetical protein VJ793_05685 [Anaerolineae bacterium]|nr:hypothetical protein [Anaerolineae bacterium]